MKDKIVTILILLLAVPAAYGQRSEDDPKHEYHYRGLADIDTKDVTIQFSDAHSQENFTRIKLKITNKTDDYIIFRPSEVVFKYAHGEYSPKDKEVIIPPHEVDTKTLAVKGDAGFHVKKLSVSLKGYYKVFSKGKVQEAASFQLPAITDDFTAGPFKCTLLKEIRKADVIETHFKCIYTGEDYGLIRPAKIMLDANKGEKFANLKTFARSSLLKQGEKTNFSAKYMVPAKTADMQSAAFSLLWEDAFMECKQTNLDIHTELRLELDPNKTLEKNK